MVETRRGIAVTLAGAALLATVAAIVALSVSFAPAAAGPAPGERFYEAYYSPRDELDVANTTVNGGTYQITYAIDIRFVERTSSATLVCVLRDPNSSVLRFSPDSVRRIQSSGNAQHVEFTGVYALPPMSLGIRCHTTVDGFVKAHFSNITLTTEQG